MAKSTTPKKKSSNALAGALAAFDETSPSSAAQSMIASEAVVVAPPEPTPTPITATPEPIVPPAEPTPVVVTETPIKAKAASRKKAEATPIVTPPSSEPATDSTGIKVNAVLYGQFEAWQKDLTHSKNHALNQTLFVELIKVGVIPTPPQSLYFGSHELRLAYLQQALREAVKQNFNQVMLTLDEILKRPAS